MSPKQELIATLAEMRRLTEGGAAPAGGGPPMALRLVQMRGLLDHACVLAQRVGEVAKPRKPKVVA